MDGLPLPIIKVSLQEMKMTIVHAFTEHLAKRDADIQRGIEAAIDSFNVEAEVQQQATQHFRSTIAELVRDAIHKVMWDNAELRAKVVGMVADEISDYVRKNV